MSNEPSALAGCAVDHDGQLLDASQIQWFHDADDNTPLPQIPTLTSNAASSSSIKIRIPPPAARVAGQRRTERGLPAASRCLTERRNTIRAGKRRASSAGLSSQDESVSRDCFRASDSNRDDRDVFFMDTDTNLSDGVTITDMTDDDHTSSQMSATALGDTDRAAMVRPKGDRTADIRTIFTVEEKGHLCSVCKANGITDKRSLLTGSVTSLRLHIARHKDHVAIYKARCEKAGVPVNPRALPKDDKPNGQTTLDAHVVSQPRVPTFTTAGLLDYIVELIVTEDDAFLLVDKGPFRRLLQYARPGLAEKDIPHRKKVRSEILQRAKLVESRIKDQLRAIKGRISFTFDTWTSDAQDPYLSVTGHYIPTSDPQKWELREEQLAFALIEGNHSGSNIAKLITCIIDRYDVRKKIGWFTADNAANNDTAIRSLAENIPEAEIDNYRERRIRCMEHAIHLSAKHFVDNISPTSSSQLTKKLRAAAKTIKNAQLSGRVDLDELNEKVNAAMEACDPPSESEDNDDEDFDVADALGDWD